MKKLEFVVPNFNKKISINLPTLNSKLDKTQKLLKLIDYIKTSTFFLLIFLLPLSFLFDGKSNLLVGNRFATYESSTFQLVMIFGLMIFGLTLAELSLAGFKRLIDPAGLLVVLVFSLLITAAAVLVENQLQENTFGIVEGNTSAAFKALSGVAVIAYLFVFYTTSSLVRNEKTRHLVKTLLLSSFSLVFLSRLIEVGTLEYLMIGAFSTLFLLNSIANQLSEKKFKNKIFLYSKLILLGVFIWNLFAYFSKTTAGTAEQLVISLFITSLVILVYKFAVLKKVLLLETLNTKHQTRKRIIPLLTQNIFLVYSTTLLIVGLIIKFTYSVDISNTLELAWNGISNGFKLIDGNARSLFVGTGSSKAIFSAPFTYSIIVSHGILGLVSYLIVWLFGIYTALTSLKSSRYDSTTLRSIESLELTQLLFRSFLINYVILIPVLSLFIYPGFGLLIFWWIALAILLQSKKPASVKKSLDKIELIKFGKLKLNLDKSKKFRLFLSLITVVISFIIIYIFVGNLGEIF